MEVSEGQVLAGKYRIERVLGQGGMGVVVAAHHLVLDQVVAIKFLLPEVLGSADTVARFEREARAAVKIQSEHVARVTDVSRLENGAPYMVMELLRGRDLEALLRERGPLPLSEVADYVLQAGEAIAEAHGLGIVHRDLKPPNLFLTQRADGSSCVKVLDFGISKLMVPGSGQALTKTEVIMGSPVYMSPEQLMSSRDIDMRTDIWALGVICFELLTGNLPFRGDTLPQLCMAITLSPPAPLRNYRPDLPVEVEAMLLRCLTRDLDKRYATVAEFAAELVKYAPPHARLSAERIERLARSAGFSAGSSGGFPASTLVLPPSSGSTAASAQTNEGNQTIGGFGRTRSSASSSKLRVGLVLGGVLAVGGAAAFARGWLASPKPAPAPASSLSLALPALPESTVPVVPVAALALASRPPLATQPSVRLPSAAVSMPPKPGKANGRAPGTVAGRPLAAPIAPPAPTSSPVSALAVKPKPAATGSVFDDR